MSERSLEPPEAAACQLGRLSTRAEARPPLRRKGPAKFDRAAHRWLSRYMTEAKPVSLLKERLVWRSKFEALDQARKEIATYIQTYHPPPVLGAPLPHPSGGQKDLGGWKRLAKPAARSVERDRVQAGRQGNETGR
jgi:hypothetical protein